MTRFTNLIPCRFSTLGRIARMRNYRDGKVFSWKSPVDKYIENTVKINAHWEGKDAGESLVRGEGKVQRGTLYFRVPTESHMEHIRRMGYCDRDFEFLKEISKSDCCEDTCKKFELKNIKRNYFINYNESYELVKDNNPFLLKRIKDEMDDKKGE